MRKKPAHHSSGHNRQIFQTYPPRIAPSLLDVRDALEASKSLDGRDRIDYCRSIGIDYDRVCTYYDIVITLERCYDTKNTPSPRPRHPPPTDRSLLEVFKVIFAILWQLAISD